MELFHGSHMHQESYHAKSVESVESVAAFKGAKQLPFGSGEQEADSNSAADAALPAQGTLSAAAACQSPQVKPHKDGS
jgi:hypothetical protein